MTAFLLILRPGWHEKPYPVRDILYYPALIERVYNPRNILLLVKSVSDIAVVATEPELSACDLLKCFPAIKANLVMGLFSLRIVYPPALVSTEPPSVAGLGLFYFLPTLWAYLAAHQSATETPT